MDRDDIPDSGPRISPSCSFQKLRIGWIGANLDQREVFASSEGFTAQAGGITTFITNQNGVVYEKDLGKSTIEAAAVSTEFNPDKTWLLCLNKLVEEKGCGL